MEPVESCYTFMPECVHLQHECCIDKSVLDIGSFFVFLCRMWDSLDFGLQFYITYEYFDEQRCQHWVREWRWICCHDLEENCAAIINRHGPLNKQIVSCWRCTKDDIIYLELSTIDDYHIITTGIRDSWSNYRGVVSLVQTRMIQSWVFWGSALKNASLSMIEHFQTKL